MQNFKQCKCEVCVYHVGVLVLCCDLHWLSYVLTGAVQDPVFFLTCDV